MGRVGSVDRRLQPPGRGRALSPSLVHPHPRVGGHVGQRPEITHGTSPAISGSKPRERGESPNETWRREGEDAARQGRCPHGTCESESSEGAASARAAADGCGLEQDPTRGIKHHVFLAPASSTRGHDRRCYSEVLIVLPCKNIL